MKTAVSAAPAENWLARLGGPGLVPGRKKAIERPISGHSARQSSTAALALLALGIVFGDIGTSPLYAVKQTFNPDYGLALTAANILGGLSTIFWILTIVVSLKYVMLVMRADNHGEGGIMALFALARTSTKTHRRWTPRLLAIAMVGASLFYGDAVLTPAISVLSAVEGLEIGTSAFKPYLAPLAAGILFALFLMQARGTARVGRLFGPVCALWFLAIGAAGAWNIAINPAILKALDPAHALRFVTGHGVASFIVLGAVLLAITGAEALYADMGHLGRRPIRAAWFAVVAPALVLNYFGQGALLMTNPHAVENPFYLAFPAWALYPMVALATAATVIASQATISGAYSMTSQAIQLGYLPRMNIRHTSEQTMGQIYVPVVNWLLLGAVLLAVVGFGSSAALAAAYGVAVMGTMLATTCLMFFVMRFGWRWPLSLVLAATGVFVLVDLTLLAAALLKIDEGGWFPLLLGASLFIVMTTWRWGRQAISTRLRASTVPLSAFLQTLFADPPPRVPGTAVFLTRATEATPSALLHNLKHNKVLHARVVLLTLKLRKVPYVTGRDRVVCHELGHGCWLVQACFGFMQRPDIPAALALCTAAGLDLDAAETTFFVSRETILPTNGDSGIALWRERLFAVLMRNAGDISEYLNLPTNRVVELGTRVEM
jgi:KUP system potassium uptake protein